MHKHMYVNAYVQIKMEYLLQENYNKWPVLSSFSTTRHFIAFCHTRYRMNLRKKQKSEDEENVLDDWMSNEHGRYS